MPDSYASTTAWTRSRRPSFISSRATWVLTVVSETISSAAISALERPRATQRKTSSSRAVSSSRPGGGAGGVGEAAANSWISRRVMRRRQQRLALRDDPDARGELLGRDVLEQEPGRAGAQRLVDVLVEVEGGEHQDAHRVLAGLREQPPRRLDPVELGHADVHQHDVGLQPRGLLDGVEPVGRLADHLEVVLGVEDHAEPGAHERLVVGDQQADAQATLSSRTSSRKGRAHAPAAAVGGAGLELAAVEPHALAHAHEAVAGDRRCARRRGRGRGSRASARLAPVDRDRRGRAGRRA